MTKTYSKTNITDLLTIYLTLISARVACVTEHRRLWKTLDTQVARVRDEIIARGVPLPPYYQDGCDMYAAAYREAARLHREHNRAKAEAHFGSLDRAA